MKPKASKEKYTKILNKRIVSEKFTELTALFDLNTSLYIIPSKGFMPMDKEELTTDFIQDICNAFGQYYGRQVSCKLENYPIGGESIWLIITPTEE